MKPVILLATCLTFSAAAAFAPAQLEKPTISLGWGASGQFSRWSRYGSGRYKFSAQLPPLDKLPELLDFTAHRSNSYEGSIGIEQLRTLSRCNFFDSQRPDYDTALQKWRAWWTYYGSGLSGTLKTEGRMYPEAWKAIAPRDMPCPTYSIALPVAWTFKLSFRSGDYGVIVQEEITMNVTADTASLRRRFQRHTRGRWESEQWKGLSPAECQSFLASLIYAIDNPWIYADDKLSTGDGYVGSSYDAAIKGRPKEWTDYYPGVDWTGVLDPEGRVLINDDVWNWDTTNGEARANGGRGPMLDYPIGVVFRVLRDRFPDPTWKPELSRWVPE